MAKVLVSAWISLLKIKIALYYFKEKGNYTIQKSRIFGYQLVIVRRVVTLLVMKGLLSM
ncbi:hypothetical protein QNI19_13785 [Cytophagaceae bacterium DM2B3-1]|uniref:Transcriptional regulator n=1 Tax=Xanthocytophaga flava TaxID=3048013 RepID=A0ABT7CJY8_9BACT|nr:hypothetical protein [Xanthocytophaga flavus]MDJ1494008.1 hypothetical protein [Xanthocytophaga flavus]